MFGPRSGDLLAAAATTLSNYRVFVWLSSLKPMNLDRSTIITFLQSYCKVSMGGLEQECMAGTCE
jgi:hypothetical protein